MEQGYLPVFDPREEKIASPERPEPFKSAKGKSSPVMFSTVLCLLESSGIVGRRIEACCCH